MMDIGYLERYTLGMQLEEALGAALHTLQVLLNSDHADRHALAFYAV